MRAAALPLALALVAIAAPAQAQADFTITGVRVDVAAGSAEAARRAGWHLAQRKAWPELYARLTGAAPATAPRLNDGALDSIVSGIEVQREAIGPNRYIAQLAVAFDRGRASGYLGASARLLRSAPMLLMPVEIDGGAITVFERRGPWAEAWRRFRIDSSAIAYVRPSGTAADALVLTGWQAYRPDRLLWRAALSRYQAANVLVAEARLVYAWPGGPVTGHFRALLGPDAKVADEFTLRAGNADEFRQMLDLAVERIDRAYTAALRAGVLRAEEDLIAPIDQIALGDVGEFSPVIGAAAEPTATLVAEVATPTIEAANGFEAAALATQGVSGAALTSVNVGGVSRIRIDYAGTLERLRYNLDQAGLRLEPAGGGYRLRQRLANEATLPPPTEPTATAAAEGADTVVTDDAALPVIAPPPPPPAPEPRRRQPAPPPSDTAVLLPQEARVRPKG